MPDGCSKAPSQKRRNGAAQAELVPKRTELAEDQADGIEPQRPRTRADCASVPRPCPYVSCKHHVYLHVTEAGSLALAFPEIDPWNLPSERSCVLDVIEAAKKRMTLEEVGEVLGVTKQRIEVIESRALAKLAERFRPDDRGAESEPMRYRVHLPILH